MTDDSLGSTTLIQRLVLIGLSQLAAADETPVHAGEIARTCSQQTDAVDADVVGSVSEAEATRALNDLEADGLVETTDSTNHSPVGKGRPRYEPAIDASALIEAFGDDDDRLDAVLDDLDG
ncbi:MAG: hypothetical protein ABEJ73_11045 [Haloplanus sp.]